MSNEEEVIVDPNNEENVETPETPPVVQPEKPVESPEDKASRLLRQTNQARKKLGLLPVGEVKPEDINNNDPQFKDELRLTSKGLSDEAIEQAKVIAKGKGVSLTEAIKDPLFITWKQDQDEKDQKEKAKLGASQGSGESPESEDPALASGSSREDHQKAFKKLTGKK